MKMRYHWLIFLIISLIIGFSFINKVEAGSEDNVSGFAWTGGGYIGADSGISTGTIGWISFNCTNDFCRDPTTHELLDYSCLDNSCVNNGGECHNSCITCSEKSATGKTIICDSTCVDCCGPSGTGDCVETNYGVNIDSTTGNITGYAWSENIGWIDFDPSGPYPTDPQYSACINLPSVSGEVCEGDVAENEVSGWARAVSASSSATEAGGWSGWIKMGGALMVLDDLAAGYYIDEGGGLTIADESGNNSTGTLFNGPVWVSGKYDYALEFDGNNDYVKVSHGAQGSPTGGYALQFDGDNDRVQVANDPTLNVTDAVTVEAWIKLASTPAAGDYRTIIGKEVQSGGDTGGYGILSNENQTGIGFYFTKEDGVSWTIPNMGGGEFVSVSPERWYHVVGSYDKNQNLIKIYLNGDLIASNVCDGSPIGTTTKPLYIGGDPENNSAGTAEFEGVISEVRIYNRALTDDEVKEHFVGIYNDESGLVGLWKFNEGENCSAKDDSGNDNNGVLGPTCPSDSPTWIDNAGNLNIANKVAIEAWIKPASTTAADDWRTVIGKQSYSEGGGTEGSGYELVVDEDQDTIYFHVQTLWREGTTIKSKYVYVDYTFPEMDQWYHIVGMYDKDVPLIELYVNGELKDNVAKFSDSDAFGKPIGLTTKPLYIGGDPVNDSGGPREFEGVIDEVRIYHRTLSADEVKEHYEGYRLILDTTSDPKEFKGWAWGGNNTSTEAVIGWISFNCANTDVCGTSNYKVITTLSLNHPPYIAPNSTSTTQVYCNVPSGKERIYFHWQYKDDDNDPELKYDFQILDSGDNVVYAKSVTTTWSTGSPTDNDTYVTIPDDGLSFGTTYHWQVKVYDDKGNDSGWVDGGTFTTPLHAYPYPDFIFTPSKPAIDEVVTFNGTSSVCYDNNNNTTTCSNWSWDCQ